MAKQRLNPLQNLNQYAFRVYRTGNQTGIADNTATKVTLDTETYDPSGMFDTSTNRVTIPVSGYYHFSCNLRIQGTGVTMVAATLYSVTNTIDLSKSYSVGASAADRTCNFSDMFYLAAGHVLELRVTGDVSSGTVTVISDSGISTNLSGALIYAA